MTKKEIHNKLSSELEVQHNASKMWFLQETSRNRQPKDHWGFEKTLYTFRNCKQSIGHLADRWSALRENRFWGGAQIPPTSEFLFSLHFFKSNIQGLNKWKSRTQTTQSVRYLGQMRLLLCRCWSSGWEAVETGREDLFTSFLNVHFPLFCAVSPHFLWNSNLSPRLICNPTEIQINADMA